MKSNSIRYKLLGILGIVLFLLLWQLVTGVLHLVDTKSLPTPLSVVEMFKIKLTQKAPDGSTLGVHLLYSLQVVLTGFLAGVIIGVPLGIATAWYTTLDYTISPLFNFLRTIPPLAFIPLMIILFGIGVAAKAAIVVVATVVPCVINSYRGIKQTSNVYIWTVQTMGASRWQVLTKVAIPSALPLIFSGIKVGLNSALTSLVAAEMLGAVAGLGFMMQMGRMYSIPELIIVGMLMLGLLGFVTSIAFDLLEKKVIKGERW